MSRFGDKDTKKDKGPQILTRRMKFDELRLIKDDGEPEIMSREDAEALSEETGLDLVIMSLTSNPPVVKLLDYGKFKFETEKREREARKKQRKVSVKEVKMGIRIDDHDYIVKMERAKKFLTAGDKVKCTIRLKGREVQHKDLAVDLANRFVVDLQDCSTLEGRVKFEGDRRIVLNLVPGKSTPKPEKAEKAASKAEKPAKEKPTKVDKAPAKEDTSPKEDKLKKEKEVAATSKATAKKEK